MCFCLFMGFIYSLFTHLFNELVLNSWVGKYLQFFNISSIFKLLHEIKRNQKCYNARRILCKVLKRGMNKLWNYRRVCESARRTKEHSVLLLNYAAVQTPPQYAKPQGIRAS